MNSKKGFQADKAVAVVIKVRPTMPHESQVKCVSLPEQQTPQTLMLCSRTETKPKAFTYDYVFSEQSRQDEFAEQVGFPIVQSCLRGFNGTIFCYGQTGAGKTYTMTGPERPRRSILVQGKEAGLVPRMLSLLFKEISERSRNGTQIKVYCSFLEIYKEKLYDLLIAPNRTYTKSSEVKVLRIRENFRKRCVDVDNLSHKEARNIEEALECLKIGLDNRRVGSTKMNKNSSRSHSVFSLEIESTADDDRMTTKRKSKLRLIDLAGSERQQYAKSSGLRLEEACSINKSLSCLGKVIMALAERSKGRKMHVHYRDSKLTYLLKDSLGGNSKTIVVANVSPSFTQYAETLSTLQFAQRAKKIKNKPTVNENVHGNPKILQAEIRRLRNIVVQLKGRLSAIIPNSNQRDTSISVDDIMVDIGDRNSNSVKNAAEDAKTKVLQYESCLVAAFARNHELKHQIKVLNDQKTLNKKIIDGRTKLFNTCRMMLKIREHQVAKYENRPPRMHFLKGNFGKKKQKEEEEEEEEELDPEKTMSLCDSILNRLFQPENHPAVVSFVSRNIDLRLKLKRFNDCQVGEEYLSYLDQMVGEHEKTLLDQIEEKDKLTKEHGNLSIMSGTLRKTRAKYMTLREKYSEAMKDIKIKDQEIQDLKKRETQYELIIQDQKDECQLKMDEKNFELRELKKMCMTLLDFAEKYATSGPTEMKNELRQVSADYDATIDKLKRDMRAKEEKIKEIHSQEKHEMENKMKEVNREYRDVKKRLQRKESESDFQDGLLLNELAMERVKRQEFESKHKKTQEMLQKMYDQRDAYEETEKELRKEISNIKKRKRDEILELEDKTRTMQDENNKLKGKLAEKMEISTEGTRTLYDAQMRSQKKIKDLQNKVAEVRAKYRKANNTMKKYREEVQRLQAQTQQQQYQSMRENNGRREQMSSDPQLSSRMLSSRMLKSSEIGGNNRNSFGKENNHRNRGFSGGRPPKLTRSASFNTVGRKPSSRKRFGKRKSIQMGKRQDPYGNMWGGDGK